MAQHGDEYSDSRSGPFSHVQRYTLDKRLCGPNSRFGFSGKENIAAPTGNKSPIVQQNVETAENNQFERATFYRTKQLGLGWLRHRRK
jgi:hypothetical protein